MINHCVQDPTRISTKVCLIIAVQSKGSPPPHEIYSGDGSHVEHVEYTMKDTIGGNHSKQVTHAGTPSISIEDCGAPHLKYHVWSKIRCILLRFLSGLFPAEKTPRIACTADGGVKVVLLLLTNQLIFGT